MRINRPVVINERQAMAALEILDEVFFYISNNLCWHFNH